MGSCSYYLRFETPTGDATFTEEAMTRPEGPTIEELEDGCKEIRYLHCMKCLRELPEGESPSSYARTQTFVNYPEGEAWVVCTRHDLVITGFSIEMSPDYDPSKETPCAAC